MFTKTTINKTIVYYLLKNITNKLAYGILFVSSLTSSDIRVRVLTTTFANQESFLKWENDPVRKIYSSEKLKYYKIHKIERNITYHEE